jgi:dipeptidase D
MYSTANEVLQEFFPLCGIPRGSGNERKVSDYLASRLRSLGLSPHQDESLNIICDVPATAGCESAPLIILQGHMDMVVAASGGFLPERDSVNYVVDGDIVRTDGRSSLGADNGIGIAAILCAVKSPRHGPLRVIFTVMEEVGLQGARALSGRWLQGAEYLINGDCFHSGCAVVGCAGGTRETYSRRIELQKCTGGRTFEISLTGFPGGHSGDDIDKGIQNPIQLLCGFLRDLRGKFPWLKIAALSGGQAHNAIPMDCRAIVVLPEGDINWQPENIQGNLKICPAPLPDDVWSDTAALELLPELYGGVFKMSEDFPGLVGASSNLGRVYHEGGKLKILCMTRCGDIETQREILDSRRGVAKALGFEADFTGYAPWSYRGENELIRAAREVWRELSGASLTVTATHAGLEPSMFSEKAPELKMISIGPDITGAHSVEEQLSVSSVSRFIEHLIGILVFFAMN